MHNNSLELGNMQISKRIATRNGNSNSNSIGNSNGIRDIINNSKI